MARIDETKGQQDRILVVDDERNRLLELSHMQLVPPSVGIFDEPTRCYRINHEWASIVMGMVSWLAEVAVWRDAQHEGYSAIQEILRFKVGEDCMNFQLRQNPSNACLIEQSNDGGETWTTAFDLSLCTSIVDGASETSQEIFNQTTVNNFLNWINQFEQTIYQNYINNYVTSIIDIHPELGYGDDDDVARDNALCYAIEQFVEAVCVAANEFYDNEQNTLDQIKMYLIMAGILGSIAALAATGIGLPAAAALATVAGSLTFAASTGTLVLLYDLYRNVEQSVFNDNDAKQELQCCLFDEMKGTNADKSALESALTTCATNLPEGNAKTIAEAGQILATEMSIYAAFGENLAIGFNSAKFGLLPSCPCVTWCHRWELGEIADDWTAVDLCGTEWGIFSGAGVASVGGIFTEECTSDAQQVYIQANLYAGTNIKQVKILGSGVQGNSQDNYRLFDEEFPTSFIAEGNLTDFYNGIEEVIEFDRDMDFIGILVASAWNGSTAGNVLIEAIELSGDGVKPNFVGGTAC